MSDLLNIGTSALQAYQRTLATVGHNIANASTAGYTRQQVQLVSQVGTVNGAGFIGAGVSVGEIRRIADGYATERLRGDASALAQSERMHVLAQRMDTLLSDSSLGLNKPLADFYSALEGAAAAPLSSAARQSVLSSAETLTARFSRLQQAFTDLQRETSQRLERSVEQINGLTAAIADLNDRIALATGRSAGEPPNDLLDQRDLLLEQLAGQIGIRTTTQEDGAMNVFTVDGQALVLGTQTRQLHVQADAYRADRLDIVVGEGAAATTLTGSIQGGEIGGLLEFQRTVLEPVMAELGRIAAGIGESVNEQQAAGLDLYGQMGTMLFGTASIPVYGHVQNSGNAAIGVDFDDIGSVSGQNYVLRYDGANWQLQESQSGAAIALTGSGTLADPFVAAGLRITVSGTASAQDRFLIVPTQTAAGQIGVRLGDPGQLALAAPILGEAALGNTGNARLQDLAVTDAGHPDLRNAVTLEFISNNSYTLNGSGPFAYSEGTLIAFQGWQARLSGTPVAGDVFRILPTPAGSGDNRNAQAMSALRTQGLLDGGSRSASEGYAALVVRTGVQAQQAERRFEAQTALTAQDRDARDATAGVNLDEEAANLVRFQQAYQAAAQAIAVADTVFQSLLNAVRR